jgi:uncharacterized protein YkwD
MTNTTYRGYTLETLRPGTPTETVKVSQRGEFIAYVHPEKVHKVIDGWMIAP